ncbi:MAG TPA: hypothetical protein VK150_03380, partial [Geothrix sp.]|nr:hypothetical protein [Geothrix sp.]
MSDKECRMALKNRIILIAGDILAALLALPASLAVKLRALPGPEDIRALGWGMVAGFVAVVVFLSFLAEFYGSHR